MTNEEFELETENEATEYYLHCLAFDRVVNELRNSGEFTEEFVNYQIDLITHNVNDSRIHDSFMKLTTH